MQTAEIVAVDFREQLRLNGFVVFKAAIDPAILEAAVPKVRATMKAFEGQQPVGDLPYCMPLPMKEHYPIIDHAEALLQGIGAEPHNLYNLMLIMKRPHEGRRFWHTDCPAIFAPSDEDAPELFALYFLQKTTVQNGALLVVPGYAEGPQHSERVTTPMDGEYAIETEPGDMIVFDPRLLHGSMPNDTDDYRFNIRLWIQTNWKDKSCH